ncbi:MAG: DMT family transporter [Candidatus Methanoplasma sp.]|jgi:drug/metabolite transporter (DMT)-like permease|nr:DMT family transporter [Candidatus Methanoplasma sp.]
MSENAPVQDDRTAKIKAKKDRAYGVSGTSQGLISGFTYGINGLILTVAFTYCTPLSVAESFLAANFIAPLLTVIFNDLGAAVFTGICNISRGTGREIIRTLKTRPGKVMCIAALAGGPLAQGGYYIGLSNAGLSYTSVIAAMYVVLGPLLGRLFLKQSLTWKIWVGVLACVIGSIVMCWVEPEGAGPTFLIGIIFAFVAAIGWASEGVIATHSSSAIDPKVAINLRFGISGLASIFIFVPILTLVATTADDFNGLSMFIDIITTPQTLGILLLAGLFDGISSLWWYKSDNMIGVGKGMALNSTYVAWGIVFGVLLLGEPLTLEVVIGGILVMFGAFMVSLNPTGLIRKRRFKLWA